jgi:hypothetical protein
MKLFNIFLAVLYFSLFSCTEKKPLITDPNHYMTVDAQETFKYQLVRYFEKLPKRVNHDTKFDSVYDSIYRAKASRANLLFIYKNDVNEDIYFAISKIAPSISQKKVAIIGKVRFEENDSIAFYEEKIRTWKMTEQELYQKTLLLFETYINNQDLTPYLTKNSGPEFYIEFPDELNFYNTEKRMWETK